MARSTTVHVVNTTAAAMTLDAAVARPAKWAGQRPSAEIAPRATATFVSRTTGRFSGTAGSVAYRGGDAVAALSWSNPFVGRNTYAMDVRGTDLGCVCDGSGDEQEATVTFTLVPATRVSVPGFRPSANGFRFTNSWPHDPLRRINLRIVDVPIGDASNGLCGGMVFAARDWFEARRPIPPVSVAPDEGDPVRAFIVDRLIDSFDLPAGVLPYALYMRTHFPGHDGDGLAAVGASTSRASVLARSTWPAIKRTIDGGHPCPLGLVMVVSDDLHDLKHQHQVLAYAYRVSGTQVVLWVYDPNSPGDDGITISFDTARTNATIAVTHNVDADGPLVCAFVPRYSPRTPPVE